MLRIGCLLCLAVAAADFAAGILSIEAETTQNKMSGRPVSLGCEEPDSEAFKLGLTAAVLLGVAHVSANLYGGCLCISFAEDSENSTANRQFSFGCLILSWITMAVGFPMLIIGTLATSKSRASCGVSRQHFLSTGGVLCFVHATFCIAFYVSAAARIGKQRRQDGAFP